MIETLLPLHLKTLFHLNSAAIGLIYFLLLLSTFSAPLIGHLSDRIGPKVTVSTGFVFLSPLLILLRLIQSNTLSQLILLCVLLFLIGLALNLILTPIFTETKEAVDEIEERAPGVFGEGGAYAMGFALMNMAYAAGSLVGPLLGSLMVGRIGWRGVTTVVGVVCAVCVGPSVWAVGGKLKIKWRATEAAEE